MTLDALLTAAAWAAFIACVVYLVVIAAVFALMTAIAVRENRLRARELDGEDFETLRESPFTIPVSVIVPAFNESVCVVPVVESLLALRYADYEVIVVNDGSTDDTLDRLRDRFSLEPTGSFYRQTLPHAAVRQMYRSRTEPRLMVLDKVNGGKADALNCGINLARYRYVCCVDGDTVYFPDTLLKSMRLVMRDPLKVLGVTSLVLLSSRPEGPAGDGVPIERNALIAFQMFDFLRAFVTSRLAWSRWNYMLCASGAFAIWRRDVVLDLGGFSPRFTCEDIEFTFRVHQHFRHAGTPYRIHALADPVGVTEGPNSIGRLITQRARWQRVIAETVWHYRRMFCNPRYGTVGLLGMPYYLMGEVLAPVFQLLGLAAIPLAIGAGLLDWGQFVQTLAIVALGIGIFTNAAILLLDRTQKSFAARDLPYMVLLGPLDLFLYRPVIFYAQFKGTIDFLRGDRGWYKSERNQR